MHDPDGNLVNDGSKEYVWDAENRLIEVRQSPSKALIASYRYDYMSRRIQKTTTAAAPQGARETRFHYDGWNLMAEYQVVGTSLEVLRTYTWGPDLSGSLQGAGGVGGLLAVDEKDGYSIHHPLYDGNGNVLAMIQGNSTPMSFVSAVYEYDAFGNTVLVAEAVPEEPVAVAALGQTSNTMFMDDDFPEENPFRFSTKYFDKETGFYYYGYRYFDPVTGRWPSRDPLKEPGFELLRRQQPRASDTAIITSTSFPRLVENQAFIAGYSFVGNNPVVFIDILGLDRQLVGGVHLDVKIDNWKEKDGKWVKNGSSTWGFGPDTEGDGAFKVCCKAVASVVAVPGIVYEIPSADSVIESPPLVIRKTTPCDDRRAKEKLEKLLLDPELYNAAVNNCRGFARGFLSYGINGRWGKKEEPCRNPDGTLWEE